MANCTEEQRQTGIKMIDNLMNQLEETAMTLEEGVELIPISYEEQQQHRKESRERYNEYMNKRQENQ